MTTLRDRSGHDASDSPAQEDAFCPHCGGHMQAGVELPWPPEPAVCPTCERWVGRGRAVPGENVSEPADGAGALASPNGQQATRGDGARQGPRRGRPGSPERRRARDAQSPGGSAAAAPSEGREAVAAGPSALAGDAPAEVAPSDDDGAVIAGAPVEAPTSNGDRSAAPVESEAQASVGEEAIEPVAADDAAVEESAVAEPVPEGADPSGGVTEAPDEDGHAPEPEPLHEPTREHTVPFPALVEEPKRRRRFPFLRRKAPVSEPPRAPRSARNKLLRALPIVLLVIGALLLAEAALTVLWKEPISALLTAGRQSALGDDLKKMEDQAAAEATKNRRQMVRYQQRAALKLNRTADPGDPIGRLRVPKIGLNMVVVQSTDEASLQKGPAHYGETPLPGQKGNWTVGIAGHRTTYSAPFRNNDRLKAGNKIIFTLPYGRFTYEVTKTRIVDAGYKKAFVPQGRDMIVLTACHPLYSAAQRILVYGKLTKSEARGKAKSAARA